MTQENKELLLKDLCARLSYGVKIYLEDFPNATLVGVVNEGIILHCDKYKHVYDTPWNIEYVKPYLFPLSSMTDEQKVIYGDYCYEIMHSIAWDGQFCSNELYDWLNKNHFDYRGLIPMGSALDATGLNIY